MCVCVCFVAQGQMPCSYSMQRLGAYTELLGDFVARNEGNGNHNNR